MAVPGPNIPTGAAGPQSDGRPVKGGVQTVLSPDAIESVGNPCVHCESEGVDGNGPALPWRSFRLYEFVHFPEGIGGEEHFAALSADLGRYVPENIQVFVPAMDVLDAFLRDRSPAERALFHGWFTPSSANRTTGRLGAYR